VSLIFIALFSYLFFKEDIIALISGFAGFGSVVSTFLFKPTEGFQKSRGQLAQMQTICIGWINNVHDWNDLWYEYIDKKQQIQKEDLEVCKAISDITTEQAKIMVKLIDVCFQKHDGDEERDGRED
jgi:hypothetical protein